MIVAETVVRAHEIMREFIPMIGRFKDAFGLTPESDFEPLKMMLQYSGEHPRGTMTGRTEAGHCGSKYKKKYPPNEENGCRCEAPIHDDKFRQPGSAGHTAWIKKVAYILADEMTEHIKEMDRPGRIEHDIGFDSVSPELRDMSFIPAYIGKDPEEVAFLKPDESNKNQGKKELHRYPIRRKRTC